jgi:hypothetical protein
MKPQALRDQRKTLNLGTQLVLRKLLKKTKEMSHGGKPTVDGLARDEHFPEPGRSDRAEHSVREAEIHDVFLVEIRGHLGKQLDRKAHKSLVVS